jgi:hypothetical protein
MTTLFDNPRFGAEAALYRPKEAQYAHAVRDNHRHAPVAKDVALLVDPSRLRRIHLKLAQRLANDLGIRVTLICGRLQRGIPASVDLLLEFERLIYRRSRRCLSERIGFKEMRLEELPERSVDLIIDLCGIEASAPKGRVIRVLYDGVAGESVLFGALMAGRMPTIELEEAQTGIILARGIPCADNAATISDAFEYALTGLLTLVLSAARGLNPQAAAHPRQPQSIGLRQIVALELKTLARSVARRLYQLCFHSPHWRTCWRVLDGPDLWHSQNLAGTSWNVIPDPGHHFYADPFPIVHDGKTYLFVEDFHHGLNKAVISVIPFGEHGPSGPARPVLEEPWHLSYPFVFAHAGQMWMIPESVADRSVALYRADPFPHRWVREATLISDIEASDATLVQHNGSFWMFAATRDGMGSWSDTLSIFSASDLHGPWKDHPTNPILIDSRAARPAGAMVLREGRLWRPVQDCSSGYGTGIGLAEIIRLDHDAFEQKIRAVLRPDPSWPGRRFHTLNRAGQFEFIDGSAYSPRSRALARLVEKWSGRREPPQSYAPAQ